MSYDVIGDIHGQAEKLEALLRHLGYRERGGAWRHPTRQARFVGDFIDRGPGQLRTLDIVRRMVDAGSGAAVMGNHEFNGLAYGTPDPERPGHFLRIRGSKNRAQHAAFLNEVGLDSPLHQEWLRWFQTLPLWLDEPEVRFIHACWHAEHMATLAPRLGPNNTLTDELIVASSRKGDPMFEAVEALCKGMEVDLPEGLSFTDNQGIERKRTRVRWWDEQATTFRQAAIGRKSEIEQLPDTLIPDTSRVLYDQSKPLFFGHYWFTGSPGILTPKTCCVDYSAAKDHEPLVAYRWDGEPELSSDKLVAVMPGAEPVRPLEAEELAAANAAVKAPAPRI